MAFRDLVAYFLAITINKESKFIKITKIALQQKIRVSKKQKL